MAENEKTIMDLAAIGAAFGSLWEILPKVAAGLAAIWTLIRIGEWAYVRFVLKRPPS